MRVSVLCICLFGVAFSLPTNNVRDVSADNKEIKDAIVAEIVQETLQKKKKIIKEDFEVEGFGCDVCLKAIYGINYNLAHLKTSAEDMVKKDCEALFHGDSEAIGACITLMVEKIEEYYEKVEPMIDTKHVCVKIGMCVRSEKSEETTNATSTKTVESTVTRQVGFPGIRKSSESDSPSTLEPLPEKKENVEKVIVEI